MQGNQLNAPSVSSDAHMPVFVRMSKLRKMTGLGRSTIYRLVAQDLFPHPVRLGPRAVGWRLSEIHAWSAARPATSH